MEKRKLFPFLIVVLALCAGGFWFYVSDFLPKAADFLQNDNISQSPKLFARRLDGLMTAGQNESAPLSVIIENHVNARPQAGLFDARLVYEVLAEAEITRFLAFFDVTDQVEKIGPIRSARPYLIDLAGEYGGLFVHSGGSPEALERLKTEDSVSDLNEFFGYNADYFWRDENRYAPHNLYTSLTNLKKSVQGKNLSLVSGYESWQFKDKGEVKNEIKEVLLPFSKSSYYLVSWRFNDQENNFWRHQNQKSHLDENGLQIKADNVIVQFVKSKVIDEIGRREIDLSGGGLAMIFRDGEKISGGWKKEDDRTRFYDIMDKEVILNRGVTWVEILPENMAIEVK